MKSSALVIIAVLLSTLAGAASAFEFESAVPLAIGEEPVNLNVDNLRVELSGKSVTIDGRVDNVGAVAVKNGYFAYTPIFNRLGVGEENYSKDFQDLRVSVDGKSVALTSERRGFFLGKDITALLRRVGLNPLPDENADRSKIKKLSRELDFELQNGLDWQGFVSYSWTPVFGPTSSNAMKISYAAMPQFSLEKVGGENFSQLVSQHCGDAESLGKLIKSSHPIAEYVLIERYDLPISLIGGETVSVKVSQPATNWAGVHPFASFACGLKTDNKSRTSIYGQITVAPRRGLSILVISVPS